MLNKRGAFGKSTSGKVLNSESLSSDILFKEQFFFCLEHMEIDGKDCILRTLIKD